MRPVLRRRCALAAAALLGTAGLAVATTSPGSAAAGPTLLRVSGSLLSAPAEDGGDPSYAVALANGDLVPVTGDLVDVPARARFTGTLRLPPALGLGGVTLSADSAAGRDALALVDARSLTLAVDTVERAAAPSVASGTAHQVYVAAPTNFGAFSSTDAQILAKVEQAAAYWEDAADGALTDLAVPSTITHYVAAATTTGTHCGLGGGDFFDAVEEAGGRFPAADFVSGRDLLVVALPDGCAGGSAIGRAVLGDDFAVTGGYQASLVEGDSLQTLAHEWGHSFGFMHSNTGPCEPDGGFCIGEYRNYYNVMSRGTYPAYALPVLGTAYRTIGGITTPGEVSAMPMPPGAAPVSQTQTLAPRSDRTGVRALRVTVPDTGEEVLVEYRSGTGRDAGTAYANGYDEGGMAFDPGVVMEQVDGRSAMLVTPDSGAALESGTTWTNDTGTLTVAVGTVTATGAQVTVTQTPGPAITMAPISLSGAPRLYETVQLEMDHTGWEPQPDRIDIEWYVDGDRVAVGGYGQWLYDESWLGRAVAVRVTGWAAGHRPTTVVSPGLTVLPAVIPVTANPTLSGTASVGSTLTAVGGSWDPTYNHGVTARWQWQADQNAIAGAPDSRFLTLMDAQAGAKVRACQVLSAPGYETTTICSPETAAVASLPAIPQAPKPTVSGNPGVDLPLTGNRGTWTSGVGFTYAWLVDGQAVPGATGTTFVPRAQDAGKVVAFQVTGSKPGNATATRTSDPTGPVLAAIPAAPLPTVTGTPKVGLPLTCSPGQWPTGTSFAYEWIVGGIPLGDGGRETFTPPGSYVGETISCRVTGSLPGYADTRRRSTETAAVAKGTLTGAVPKIGGTVKVGRTLTAKPGSWTSGTKLAYAWFANGTAIRRATKSTLTLSRTTRGKRITVRVTGTKTGYTSLVRTSARTGRVAG